METCSAAPPTGLNRQRVLLAAIELIDTDGLPGLTMRRLGQVLGVKAMAVYHHVASRSELLDGIARTLTEDVAHTEVPTGSSDWRRYLYVLATGFRDVLDRHPSAVSVLLTHPTSTEWWLRAPLTDPEWHQRFLATLGDCGFDATASDTAYRWFTSFLSGHLLIDSASVVTHPLTALPMSALRRSELSLFDFDTSFAALSTRLAVLKRRIPAQRGASIR